MGIFSKRLIYITVLVFFVSIMLPVCVFAEQAKPQVYNLTIIHTNDFHDYDPYALARKATIIKKIRSEVENVLLVDAGDLYVRGPYHQVFYGEMEMAALNAMNYDVWELGNNEFKGHPQLSVADEKLYNLISQAQFPTLCANIKTVSGEYLPGVKPYIVKPLHGIKIGIIGVSSYKVKSYPQAANKLVEDPVTAVRNLIPAVCKESDIQLLLSHAGLAADVQIDKALAGSGISFIIGADDHYVIPQPIYRSGGIPIAQAGGEDNIYLGRIDLRYERKDGKWILVSHRGMLYPINEKVPMDPEIKKIIDGYMAKTKKAAA